MNRWEAGTSEAKTWGVRAFNKFNNDWTMNLTAMVSYNVLTSFFPLVLALITILAYIPAAFGSTADFAEQLNRILPGQVSKDVNVQTLLQNVNHRFGLLTVVSIAGLLWGGSNLFGSIESAFAIIYRVKTRDIIPQKVMSLLMILLFATLLPISFVSTLLLHSATTALGSIMPAALNGRSSVLLGFATSLAALFILFACTYIVVPNMPVAWKHAWRGSLVAATTMLIVNTAFPFYTTHFISTKQYGTAVIGTAIIVITWFWLFSLVLLIGAQINSLTMQIDALPYDVSRMLMNYTIAHEDETAPAVHTANGARVRKRGLPFSGVVRDSQHVIRTVAGTVTSSQSGAIASTKARPTTADPSGTAMANNAPEGRSGEAAKGDG